MRATYLLGGEAGDKLVLCSINSQVLIRDFRLLKQQHVAWQDLLDHFGGVVAVFFYKVSTVKIPRTGGIGF